LEPPPAPSVTSHQITIGDQPLRYRATAGLMPIFNEKGELQANLSFVAYHAGDMPHGDASRPLIFLFNGGPGSSSVWLHLGGLGPRRVRMEDDGKMPRPPFQVVDNEHTWLTFADLVYIDPIDTGYSQAASDELAKKFRSVKGDLELTGEFIRRYLTEHQRWSSPLFLAGESYGTFRVAGLAGYLIDKGIAFNGIILISSVLELGTLLFESGDDLPYTVYLPTYTATAWYHKQLDQELLDRPLDDLLREVEQWAMSDYTVALAQGSALPNDQRADIMKRLARFTGLSETFIHQSNLRIHGERFAKELLRDEGTIVGRLDSRLTGFDADTGSDLPAFDPSMSAIRFPFTAAINHYMRAELNYENQREYQILRGLSWEWGSSHEGTPRTNNALRDAFAHNPYLHVLITSGYYDLATPFAATRYTMRRLDVSPSIRNQIRLIDYPAGHMLYLPIEQMAKLRDDTAEFVRDALPPESAST
jgi:carboxypeptidase C (cathepsin A)